MRVQTFDGKVHFVDSYNSHGLELTVIGTWNSTGNFIVFVDKESAEHALELYEEFRKEHTLPWITHKAAVDGHGILANMSDGKFPWLVKYKALSGGQIQVVNPLPLQHVRGGNVVTSDINGAAEKAEVWAATREEAEEIAAVLFKEFVQSAL